MEIINIDWCKEHGMKLVLINVARDTSYYFEDHNEVIIVYTKSTTGEKRLYVKNPITHKSVELTTSRNSIKQNSTNELTEDDLHKLCELVNIEYPFNE